MRVWDIYIKFHTVWMSVNVVALGLQVQYVATVGGRIVLLIAFVLQNLLALWTSINIASYTKAMTGDLKADSLKRFGKLGKNGAIANGAVYVILTALWLATTLLP